MPSSFSRPLVQVVARILLGVLAARFEEEWTGNAVQTLDGP